MLAPLYLFGWLSWCMGGWMEKLSLGKHSSQLRLGLGTERGNKLFPNDNL